MSRIRSVHPALFTDEAWVSCSPLARLLVIGLWTDADDQGIFEWKPLQLKMRLLPGDTANTSDLLAEIAAAGIVLAFDADGKKYGAIRNFRKFQRPQKPNSIHPLPESIAVFVGISSTDPRPVRDQYDTGTIEPQQMEEGRGKRKEELEASLPAATAVATVGPEPKPKTPKLKPEKPWLSDRAFTAAWNACTPEMRRRSLSREITYGHWKRQAALAGDGELLRQAHASYLHSDPDVKRTGGPGLHLWLKDGTWDHWTADGAASGRAVFDLAKHRAEQDETRKRFEQTA